MIELKTIAGGIAVAGSLGLAALGLGSGLANAEPSPGAPEVTSVQGASQGSAQPPTVAQPSPYAAYGGASLCATPGLYFVNICT